GSRTCRPRAAAGSRAGRASASAGRPSDRGDTGSPGARTSPAPWARSVRAFGRAAARGREKPVDTVRAHSQYPPALPPPCGLAPPRREPAVLCFARRPAAPPESDGKEQWMRPTRWVLTRALCVSWLVVLAAGSARAQFFDPALRSLGLAAGPVARSPRLL